jgi:c-di-GMP-binding flagellar brake protein YcgR
MQGANAPVRVLLRNISVGGCFVAMPTLPSENGELKIVVWVNEAKLTIQGVIASRRAGFGISIKFTDMTREVREQLQRFIQPHSMIFGS